MTLRKLLFGAILIGLCVTCLAQEATIAPNDALILENIPPSPGGAAPLEATGVKSGL